MKAHLTAAVCRYVTLRRLLFRSYICAVAIMLPINQNKALWCSGSTSEPSGNPALATGIGAGVAASVSGNGSGGGSSTGGT